MNTNTPTPTPENDTLVAESSASHFPGKPPRSTKRRWLKVLLLLVIFVSGMVIGSGLTIMGIVHHMRSQMSDPAQRALNWTHRLSRRLDLSPQEEQAVLPVMQDASQRFEVIRQEVYPRVEAELDRMQQEVAAVLPKDKVATWESQFQTLRKRWFPLPPQPGSKDQPAHE